MILVILMAIACGSIVLVVIGLISGVRDGQQLARLDRELAERRAELDVLEAEVISTRAEYLEAQRRFISEVDEIIRKAPKKDLP